MTQSKKLILENNFQAQKVFGENNINYIYNPNVFNRKPINIYIVNLL